MRLISMILPLIALLNVNAATSPRETLLFPLGKGYKMIGQNGIQGGYRQTYMLETENSTNWTERMMVAVVDQKNTDVKIVAQNLGRGFQKDCQGATVGPIVLSNTRGYAEASFIANCPVEHITNRPGAHVAKIVQGNDKLYIVEKVFSSTITPQIDLNFAAFVKGVSACDVRLKERACPEPVGNANSRDVASSDKIHAYLIEVKKVVAENMAEFKKCYRTALDRDPNLKGNIDLRWNVDSSGTAHEVTINDKISSISDLDLRACMVETLSAMKFPTNRFEKAVDVTNYPFNFVRTPAGR